MARKKFYRQNYFRFRKLGLKWRKPRGKQSKTRIGFRGKLVVPNIGYKKPDDMRGLVSGKKYFRVSNISDVEKAPANASVLLSSGIGLRKALEISTRCKELGIEVVNKKKARKAEKVSAMKKKKAAEKKAAKEKHAKEAKHAKDAKADKGAHAKDEKGASEEKHGGEAGHGAEKRPAEKKN